MDDSQGLAADSRWIVLTVDDDMLVNMGTAAMLEDLGHVAIEASSADEALAVMAVRSDIDLLITDQSMPGRSGLELIEAVRRLRPGLPVILATGHADLPGHAAAEAPLISKPFRTSDLAKAIAKALSSRVPATS